MLSKLAIALVPIVFALLFSSAASVIDAQYTVACYPFFTHGRLVHPSSWNSVVEKFQYHPMNPFHVNGTGEKIWFEIDLCNNRRFTVAPPEARPTRYGNVISIPQGNQTFPVLDFDQLLSIRTEESLVRFKYGMKNDATKFVHVDVICNNTAKELRPRTNQFYSHANPQNGTDYLFELEIDQMCMFYSTSAAPSTLPPPPTPTHGPLNKCESFDVDGKLVNPTEWHPIMDQFQIRNWKNASVWIDIDLCNNHRFTNLPPTNNSNQQQGNSGYVTMIPQSHGAPQFTYNEKLFVDHYGDVAIWHFADTFHRGNFIHVYVMCDEQAPHLTARDRTIMFFNNSDGGATFTLYLGTQQMCPPKPKPTTAPPKPSMCTPFKVDGNTVDPKLFSAASALLKDIMTGDAVRWYVDPCNENFWTTIPAADRDFKIGFVSSSKTGQDKKNGFTEVAFDLFDEAVYFSFLHEYRMRYKSSNVTNKNDRAELVITCGGGTGLRFRDTYFMALKNAAGGMTYQFQMKIHAMCNGNVHPTTVKPTLPPPPPTTTTQQPHPTQHKQTTSETVSKTRS